MEQYQLAPMLKAELTEEEIMLKQGLRTWRIPVRKLVGIYLYDYIQMRMLVLGYNNGDKIKKVQLPVDPFQAKPFMEALLNLAPPEANLLSLEKKEALSRMGVSDMSKTAPLIILAVLFALVAVPMFPTLVHGFWDTSKTTVDLASLYQGTAPSSNYIHVKGRLAEMGVTETTEYTKNGRVTNTVETDYIPLLPPNWKQGQPIKVVLEVSEDDVSAMSDKMGQTVEVDGMIENLLWEGVPGDVLDYMAKQQASPVEGAIVIAYNSHPADYRFLSYIVFGVVVLICLIIGVVIVIQSRRNA